LLDLSDLLQRKPAALSGGQRQRVALGRAIVRRPQVFLFDEPLASLDAPGRIESRGDLKRLHQTLETTTVYVTHDQEEAMTLGDRVAVMDHGLIQQCDTPLRLYQQPINRFVAGFLGTPPMNFLEGSLCREEDKLRFHSGDVHIELTAQQAHCLADHVGRRVVLGIRPEGLEPVGARGTGDHPRQSIPVTVDFVQPLGAVMDLLATTRSGERLVSRTRWEKIQPGSQIDLHLDVQMVHLFEPPQGQESAAASPHAGRNLTLAAAESEGVEW
jgi:multiple sugar transport system ATP-binding protein